MSGVWVAAIILGGIALVTNGVVQIIKAAKQGGSKSLVARLEALEEDLADHEQELLETRKRVEVLEAIVTDEKSQLKQEIDRLA
ncbi:MAG: hypothetical protein KDI36_11230 [Pseudomonadales bacterium]|nr:hypothetical protein [Pseudomonadales bacterium]